MNRLQRYYQPLSQNIQRSFLHSSSSRARPGDDERGATEISASRRKALDVYSPASPSSSPSPTNFASQSSNSNRPAFSLETEKAKAAISQSRTVGKYYSPQFLNLESQSTRDTKAPRKFPILGPSAAVAKKIDILHRLKLRPGHVSLHDDSYKNPVLLSEYVSEMGKIMGRKNTQLTRRSQREVGKAIRRARSMGLMPVMSKNAKAWKLSYTD